MDSYRIPTIIAVLVIAVVASSAAIITNTQRGRADAAETHIEQVSTTLADTEAKLAQTEADLSFTDSALTDAVQAIQEARQERDALGKQIQTCRYIVRVNDRLLSAASFQQHATGALLRQRRAAARIWVSRAGRQIEAVQRLVARSGYKTIGDLVAACAS